MGGLHVMTLGSTHLYPGLAMGTVPLTILLHLLIARLQLVFARLSLQG